MPRKLFKSAFLVASLTMLSRLLGFVRDVVFAQYFGAGPAFDAFVIAFKLPNFMRRLFADGAFSQAFVPVLAEYRTTVKSSPILSAHCQRAGRNKRHRPAPSSAKLRNRSSSRRLVAVHRKSAIMQQLATGSATMHRNATKKRRLMASRKIRGRLAQLARAHGSHP